MVGLFVRRTGAHATALLFGQSLDDGGRRQRTLVGTNRTTTGTFVMFVLVLFVFHLATAFAVMVMDFDVTAMGVVVMDMMLAVGMHCTAAGALAGVMLRFLTFTVVVYTTTVLALVGLLDNVLVTTRPGDLAATGVLSVSSS